MFELSFDVKPGVSIVRRHVKLSKEADAAITHELIELLGRATVQLHQKVGNQRRVLRSAVTHWLEDARARQAKAPKRLSKALDGPSVSDDFMSERAMPLATWGL